jgi:hypothetical protein
VAELLFSKHAVEQMLKRSIIPEDVEMIIAKPDGIFEQSRDKQVVYKRFPKRKNNLLAAVIVRQSNYILEVITVMHHFEVKT